MASDKTDSSSGGYRGWLGGYAKSVAGSVTAFTQDILEETRQDTQDIDSQLKVAQETIAQQEKKISLQNDELTSIKKQLLEAVDSKEATELQLQEVGHRWKLILQDKDEELKQMKEKPQETERKETVDVPTRTRAYSGDLDFSDPFLCEMEIGRLFRENEHLSKQLEEYMNKADATLQDNNNTDNREGKIQALQAQLRSVYNEHENELLEKEHETQQVISNLKSHYESLLQGSSPDTDLPTHISRSLSLADADRTEILEDKISDLHQQLQREKAYFKQLEDEKTRIGREKSELVGDVDKLNSKIVGLESHISSLIQAETGYSKEIRELQTTIKTLEIQSQKHLESEAMMSQHTEVLAELRNIIEEKSSQLSAVEVKLLGTELQLSNRDKEIQQLRIALNTVNSEDFQELRGLADTLKTQVEGYKDSLKETGHKLLQANKQCEELSERNDSLVSSNQSQETIISDLQSKIGQMEAQLKETVKDNTVKKEEYEGVHEKLTEVTEKLTKLMSEKEAQEKSSNKLKAEKLEMVVELKNLKGQNASLETIHNEVSSTLSALKQNPLYSILDDTLSLSESQIENIKKIAEISEGDEPQPLLTSSPKLTTSLEDLKAKLDDKSEQLQLLQSSINKLRIEKETEISELRTKNTELEEWLANSLKELLEVKSLNEEYNTSVSEVSEKAQCLEKEVARLRKDNEQLKGDVFLLSETADNGAELKDTIDKLQTSAKMEKSRLMSEIERLIGEMSETEELYTQSVTDKESLECQLTDAKEQLKNLSTDKENIEIKVGKISANLKKALVRLAVKDTKIDELADQVGQLESQLKQSNEQLDFFKNNQTDEIKAARLGFITPGSVDQTPKPSNDVTVFHPAEDMPDTELPSPAPGTEPLSPKSDTNTEVEDLNLKITETATEMKLKLVEIDELNMKLSASQTECRNLQEKSRDQELKIELLSSEVSGISENSLSSADTNKLLDQNMTLQRKVGTLDKELESVKQQNLEILHQRDFYQDQAKQFHTSMETLRSEANKRINEANEREKKTLLDFERLQQHLVESEKTHTEEFLDITKQETEMRTELGSLREQLLTANSALNTLRAERAEETESLTEQLRVISTQRDNALLQLNSAQERLRSSETGLSNLQIVLEQFQQDREGHASEVHEQYKRDRDMLSKQLETANETISQLEARVSEIKLIENELEGCKNDKSTKEELIKSLQTEVSKLDVALKVAQEGLQKARTTSEDKVERSLMKSFFTQYLIAPDNRKPEVLRLMTSILKFTDEELSSLKKQKDSKWLSNLFTPVGGAPTDVATGESFSELFISFLETEANRGSIIGSRAVSTPPIIRPSHKRNLSTTSNKSAVSVSSTAESEPTLSSFNIGSSPVVVPQSLADLLGKKPR